MKIFCWILVTILCMAFVAALVLEIAYGDDKYILAMAPVLFGLVLGLVIGSND
jgi:hypothetical protein